MIAWILSLVLLGDVSQGGAVAAASLSPSNQAPVKTVEQGDNPEDDEFSDEEEGYIDADFSDDEENE